MDPYKTPESIEEGSQCDSQPAVSHELSTVPSEPSSSTAGNLSPLNNEVQMYLDECKTATIEFKNFYVRREIKRHHLRQLTYEEVEPYLLDKEKAFLLAHPEHLKMVRKSDEVIVKELKTQMAEQASQIAESIIKELERLTEAAIMKIVNSTVSSGPDSTHQEPKNV